MEWATNKSLWPKLWKSRPLQFWYLYPSKDLATTEFEKKWVPEFLPRGDFKGHPQYGWREEYNAKKILAIHFNTGVSVYFKTYQQDAQNLQASSVHAIFCDEELPSELYSELRMRMAATDGYFHMVFTATLNQDFWRRAIEGHGKDEVLLDAFKQQISMYDCLFYEDGTPGAFTEKRITEIKAQCGSESEVQRRVYGRFVTDAGRVCPAFDPVVHYVSDFKLLKDHKVYVGVDIGSGGSTAHPAAIALIAVEPDFKKGTVFRGWRGDGEETAVSDILEKVKELTMDVTPMGQFYDWASRDFGIVSARMGLNFLKADKSATAGNAMMNTLFKNNMLFILETDELRKLGGELLSLMHGGSKPNKRDDFYDAVRYTVTAIPWDWTAIDPNYMNEDEFQDQRPLSKEELKRWEIEDRRAGFGSEKEKSTGWEELDQEFEFWNDRGGN